MLHAQPGMSNCYHCCKLSQPKTRIRLKSALRKTVPRTKGLYLQQFLPTSQGPVSRADQIHPVCFVITRDLTLQNRIGRGARWACGQKAVLRELAAVMSHLTIKRANEQRIEHEKLETYWQKRLFIVFQRPWEIENKQLCDVFDISYDLNRQNSGEHIPTPETKTGSARNPNVGKFHYVPNFPRSFWDWKSLRFLSARPTFVRIAYWNGAQKPTNTIARLASSTTQINNEYTRMLIINPSRQHTKHDTTHQYIKTSVVLQNVEVRILRWREHLLLRSI